ncbi:hypothetical protein [Photobacterium nomapromontoriensis]|uniref:hypothetical protein n=1 Tax=Photobacterium nomapromontoriensis TaxID=2910237 RepID=UPI003D100586
MNTLRTLASAAIILVCTTTQALAMGPRPPSNPHLGLDGSATMHSDSAASDTTDLVGPGLRVRSEFVYLGGTCSTVLIHSYGHPVVVCTDFQTKAPVIYIIDQYTKKQLAKMAINQGSTFGGIYAYINQHDQIVIAGGADSLLFIETKNDNGDWDLSIQQQVDLSSVIPDGEFLNAINPAADGGIWFATDKALLGRYDTYSGEITATRLQEGEEIHNSFANSGDGKVAIATDHALYLYTYRNGEINKLWRQSYDRGRARKPGKLSHGTGASPTFFGPKNGTDYVTILDNAKDGDALLIYHAQASEQPLLCKVDLPHNVHYASENSPIGIGNSVITSNTFGYPYPIDGTLPPSIPNSAPMESGMFRVDIDPQHNCEIVWSNNVGSAAVPKLSVGDQSIYTFERQGEAYYYNVIDFHSGEVLATHPVGEGRIFDTLQLAGNMTFGQVYWQGTTGGLLKIKPSW